MKKNYTINFANNTIVITKSFAAKAQDFNSPEYKLLQQFKADGFSLSIKESSPKQKMVQKKWSMARMKKYLALTDNGDEYTAILEKLANGKSYMTAWSWFKESFPNYKKVEMLDSKLRIITNKENVLRKMKLVETANDTAPIAANVEATSQVKKGA